MLEGYKLFRADYFVKSEN